MSAEITIPRLGWSMEEGIFAGWIKKDGDVIKPGDPLFTLESDKAAHDVEAVDDGVLSIPSDGPKSGDIVKVGQVIARLTGGDGKSSAGAESAAATPVAPGNKTQNSPATQAASPAAPALEQIKAPANHSSDYTSSPRARRAAAELSVDLAVVSGSGRTGRIREADVVKAATASSAAKSSAPRPAAKAPSAGVGAASLMRRSIAERTSLSFSTIPHFYLRAEVDVTDLITMRENLVDVVAKECGVRLTVTDFLLLAQARALQAFPAANAVWKDDGVEPLSDVSVGLVVGLPDGLLIPVINGVQNLSLVQLAKERARLVDATRTGSYNAAMLAGGATSLSNLGTTRVDEFAAVIAPHQSTMLAVGRAELRPYVVDGRLEARRTLRLCLSVDHRVLDGGPAAEFLGKIVELLETPRRLVAPELPRA